MNPYKILEIRQDASNHEIAEAIKIAMKKRKYPLNEIAMAARQLLNPSKRLAADFLYPTRIKAKRPKKIEFKIEMPSIDLNNIDENAFDSLKYLSR